MDEIADQMEAVTDLAALRSVMVKLFGKGADIRLYGHGGAARFDVTEVRQVTLTDAERVAVMGALEPGGDDVMTVGRQPMMDVAEFARRGYLQEVNRRFLHPLGLALAVDMTEDGTATIAGVWDARDDPEGFIFNAFTDESAAKAAFVDAEMAKRAEARFRAWGNIVQPIEAS